MNERGDMETWGGVWPVLTWQNLGSHHGEGAILEDLLLVAQMVQWDSGEPLISPGTFSPWTHLLTDTLCPRLWLYGSKDSKSFGFLL